MKTINKKGQVGLDVVKSVVLTLLTLAIIGFVLIVSLSSLTDTNIAKTGARGTADKETHNVTHESLIFNGGYDCSAVVSNVTLANQSTYSILSGNYTVTSTTGGCAIILSETNVPVYLNGSDWNLTYTYTYNNFGLASQNVSAGVTSCFSNVTTWFSLLAVVVIVLILVIILFAVSKFGGGNRSL